MNEVLDTGARITKAGRTWASKDKTPASKTFDCIRCDFKGMVFVKLDKKSHRGELECGHCGVHFATTGPVLYGIEDVIAAWVDAPETPEHEEKDEQKRRHPETIIALYNGKWSGIPLAQQERHQNYELHRPQPKPM